MTRPTLRRTLVFALGAALVGAVWSVFRSLMGDVQSWTDGDAPAPPPYPASPSALQGARYDRVLDLAGSWQVRLGDDLAWSAPVTGVPTDEAWESVGVPAAWEDEGFWGYDGFAWYRRVFTLPPDAASRAAGRPFVLRLGQVDDADEVYLNGQRIGATGAMPPRYETAYYAERVYLLPGDALRAGPNTVAVRVYDGELSGGILAGPVDVAVARRGTGPGTALVADLAGRWRFAPGDAAARADPRFDDSAWAEVTVPERWESQGWVDVNGFAWLRRTVVLSEADAARPLAFVAGAIDDLDEVFVNGVRIGGTGAFGVSDRARPTVGGDEWQRPRAYLVPVGLLRAGPNTVAVRVYDGLIDGGIVAGPVGLVTPESARGFAEARVRRAPRP